MRFYVPLITAIRKRPRYSREKIFHRNGGRDGSECSVLLERDRLACTFDADSRQRSAVIARMRLECTDRPCDLQPAFPARRHAIRNIHRRGQVSDPRISRKHGVHHGKQIDISICELNV